MENNKYGEQDIQDYAAGTFTGNIRELEDFLSSNPVALEMVKEYKLMYGVLAMEETPSLSFSLAEKVITKIEYKKEVREPVHRLLPYILIGIAASALLIISRHFDFTGRFAGQGGLGLFLASTMIMFLFLFGFYRVEARRKERILTLEY